MIPRPPNPAERAALYVARCCPYCFTQLASFELGPRGGLMRHVSCPCGARFNVLDALLGVSYELLSAGERNKRPAIRCRLCGYVSWHAQDIVQRYCGACHRFHDDPLPDLMTDQVLALPPLWADIVSMRPAQCGYHLTQSCGHEAWSPLAVRGPLLCGECMEDYLAQCGDRRPF